MKIKINYFASLREAVGQSEMLIESDEISLTAEKVWTLSTGKVCLPDKVLVAINQEYVALDAKAVDGDEVAFFPPVTGG
jgi:molybdopterin synthase sulfur carrier subunit